jgi:hypothetical protein
MDVGLPNVVHAIEKNLCILHNGAAIRAKSSFTT